MPWPRWLVARSPGGPSAGRADGVSGGDLLRRFYGPMVAVRPPAPVSVNKGRANYKSQIPRTVYHPRAEYREWLAICEAVLAAGGDAVVLAEDGDERYLDAGDLEIDAGGNIFAASSGARLGHVGDIDTGRVFAANGPWVSAEGGVIRAVLPRMLPHRRREVSYARALLSIIAADAGAELELEENPHSWEGLADVAVVGDRVILTHAVPGRYDRGVAPQAQRSTREGSAFAADFHRVPEAQRIHVELVYPHFHGDTAHFCARAEGGRPILFRHRGALREGDADAVQRFVGAEIVDIGRADARDHYATNARQIGRTLLATAGVSERFESRVRERGLELVRLDLDQLFGVAGGGPACTTLILPADLAVAETSPLRFSRSRQRWHQRQGRIAESVRVDPGFFGGSGA